MDQLVNANHEIRGDLKDAHKQAWAHIAALGQDVSEIRTEEAGINKFCRIKEAG